jgi:hypothetical protein
MAEQQCRIVIGDHVILRSFNGLKIAPVDETQDNYNNYWLLIGEGGLVVKDTPCNGIDSDRVLVRFHVDVGSLGLHCHNEIENALWIRRNDLDSLPQAKDNIP